MALLCGSTSVPPFLSHKNVVAASTKSSFVGFQLPLPKLTLSSSVRTLLPSNSRIRCQQDSATAAPVTEDPRFACVEPEPRFKGPVQYNPCSSFCQTVSAMNVLSSNLKLKCSDL